MRRGLPGLVGVARGRRVAVCDGLDGGRCFCLHGSLRLGLDCGRHHARERMLLHGGRRRLCPEGGRHYARQRLLLRAAVATA